jgi:nitric oxide reductase NorD protein
VQCSAALSCPSPGGCRVNTIPLPDAKQCVLPVHLKRDQQRLLRQFAALLPVRLRLKAQPEGNDIDIDPYIRHLAHSAGAETRFYLDQRERDLACLLLADMPLSTEAWVGEDRRVIDVIRDSLFLFSEALSVTRDRFALYGFSSHQRTDVRFHILKAFNEPYDDDVRGRINSISPAYYTRKGAAIRHAAEILGRQNARERLLLLLTDGKTNDADHYEGRYGIEDTPKALIAARHQGLRPFCVTVDQEAHEYLPHIFGKNNFIIIRNPSELPARLPLLYAILTR